jgi:signal transduction histidine kinase
MTPSDAQEALRLPLIGLLLFVAFNQVAMAIWHRHERIHRWLGLFALNAAVFTYARWWQLRAGLDVELPLKIQDSTLLLLQPLGLGWAASIGSRSPAWVARWQVAGVAVALLPWAGDLILSTHNVAYEDALGGANLTRRLRPPGALVLAPYIIASAGAIYLVARRVEPHRYTSALRRTLMASAIVVGIAVTNDLLLVAGVLRTVRVIELALLVPVVGVIYVAGRRAADIYDDLEAAVVERTRGLERANRGLAEALANLRTLIDGMPDSVLVARGGVVLLANRAADAAFGRPAGTTGARLDELVVGEARPLLEELLATTERGAGTPRELRCVGPDGVTWVGEVACLAVSFEGAPAVIAIVRNVDERVGLQRQLLLSDRLASVGTLAAGVAHEINNPLTYILGNLESAREDARALAAAPSDELRDQVLEALGAAEEGALRVGDIVRDMRMFARNDGGEPTAVDLNQAIASSLNLVRNELRHRATLVTELADVAPVIASEGRLSQVLVNLLVNAAQAMDGVDGSREVRVRTAAAGGCVVVEVIDSGRGLTAEARTRAFDPFFTTKPIGQGTGLGLSICHSIVTGFGGTIELIPRADARGTIARVTLRAARDAIAAPATPASAPAATRWRVLVVDDERQVRATLRRMLKSCDVTLAGSGSEALAFLERDRFDVIVCDLMMPGMSGIELFDQLRTRNPEQARRIIFVTGGAFTEDARQFLDSVTNPQLDKPLDPRRLWAAVRSVGGATA